MTDNDDATYYYERAEQEERAARAATNATASAIHLSLAERYRIKALGREESQKIRLVRD